MNININKHLPLLNKNFNSNDIKIKASTSWLIIPDEILQNIFNLIPNYKKINLCKKYYIKYHYLVKSLIPIHKYEDYLFNLIKQDQSFVFENVLRENITKWLFWKDYRYKSSMFSSYLYFLFTNIEMKNAYKCKKIMMNILEEHYNKVESKNENNKKSSLKIKNWFKNNNIKNVKIEYG